MAQVTALSSAAPAAISAAPSAEVARTRLGDGARVRCQPSAVMYV